VTGVAAGDAELHPTAIVEAGARIGAGCRIGPYCIVGPEASLGEGVRLHAHVSIAGRTTIGAGTVVFPFASLGQPPQDFSYSGEPTELVIGARNTFREYSSASTGTAKGGGVTRIGDDCYFMMHTHVGHDCILGDRVVMANCVSLSGHVEVGDGAVFGGLSGVHQFVRIGRGAMIGGLAAVPADVIPYGMVAGDRARLIGLNLVGLKRRRVPRSEVAALRAAFAEMFEGEDTLKARVAEARAKNPDNALVAEIAEFVLGGSERRFTLPPGARGGARRG
jgi:UDP-N-acetylglucosamine acyltransferase